MTREEAVARIKDHIEIHRYHERNAVKIFEALDMAIKALKQPEPCEDDPRADVYYLAEKIGIHQLYALVVQLRGEPEPCEDAVSRKAVQDTIRKWCGDCVDCGTIADEVIPKLSPVTLKQRTGHWIPVTERLPDKNRVVVVCGEKGTWDYGTYRGHGDNIHFWHWKKNTFKRVYWWMYKEDAIQMPSNAK